MGLPSICSQKPADSSTLMRPVASAASQSRCVTEVWWKIGHFKSWTIAWPLGSMLIPSAVRCQWPCTLSEKRSGYHLDNSQMTCGQEQSCGYSCVLFKTVSNGIALMQGLYKTLTQW